MVRLLKRRYIGFRIASEQPYTRYGVLNLILRELQTINRNHTNKTRIKLLEYEREKRLGILRCDHKSVDKVRCLFNAINEKNRGKIAIQILGVSGTIKSLRRKLLDKTD